MTLGGTLRAVVTFVILVLLHYTLRPLLGWRAPMDFLLLALLLASIRVRPAVAALIGLALGLVADSLTPEALGAGAIARSEEHTSELQSQSNLVCRLLLEKKNQP